MYFCYCFVASPCVKKSPVAVSLTLNCEVPIERKGRTRAFSLVW